MTASSDSAAAADASDVAAAPASSATSTASAGATAKPAAAAAAADGRAKYIQSLQEDNNKLKAQLKDLQAKLDQEKKRKQSVVVQESINEAHAKDPMVHQSTLVDFLIQYGGLSRFTLFDDHWHRWHPAAANQLFGFKTWPLCKELLLERFGGADFKILDPPKMYKSNKRNKIELGEATALEKCLCIKMQDRMGLTKGRIAIIFGRDERTIGKWRAEWCPKWGFDLQNDAKHEGRTRYFQSKPMIKPGPVPKKRAKHEAAIVGESEVVSIMQQLPPHLMQQQQQIPLPTTTLQNAPPTNADVNRQPQQVAAAGLVMAAAATGYQEPQPRMFFS